MPPRAVGEAHPPKLERAWNPIVSSLSHEVGGSVSVGSPIDILLSDKIRFRLGAGLRKERPVHKLSRVASILASTSALVVIVAWLAFCKIHRSDRRATGLVQRHLSDYGEENELESILEGCLELREELGLSHDVSEPDEPPEAKKARLFLMLRESGEAFERARENSLQPLQAGARGLTHESSAREQSQLLGDHTLNYSSQGEMSRSEGTAWLPAAAPKRKSARRRISNDSLGSASTRVIPSPSASPKVSISARLASSPRASSGSDAKGQSPEDWLSRDVEGSSPKGEEQGPPGGQSLHNSPIRMGLTGFSAHTLMKHPAVLTGASFVSMLGPDGTRHSHEDWLSPVAKASSPKGDEPVPQRGESPYNDTKLMRPTCFPEATSTSGAAEASFVSSDTEANEAAGYDLSTGAEQNAAKMASDQEVFQERTSVGEGAQQAEERVDDVGVSQHSTPVGQLVEMKFAKEGQTLAGKTHLHPFVRLPPTIPKDITQLFNGVIALSSNVTRGSPMKDFNVMRMLFAKRCLTGQDVSQLMAACRCLIAYACQKLTSSPSKSNPFYIVRRLAATFMVFDYVVSTIQVLGDKANIQSWWPHFVGRFDTDANVEIKAFTHSNTEYLATFCQRLSDALAIYKTGVRPPPNIIIKLKRDILSKLRHNSIFENSSWELWEEDDALFH
ncbi:hypothetical protein, conserved [Eimeria maxima]|uniref:Transmembrane protein n=1 Tax=Eimeria maxima TaxID=5804 RepID=U6MDC6_EIMMA|nr:hypothetical protein, conserved [Eimeria maxima]CDJ59665.1 hypothetical protein, conserved [Eimeria maxima]